MLLLSFWVSYAIADNTFCGKNLTMYRVDFSYCIIVFYIGLTHRCSLILHVVILQEKKLLNLPKLLDICATYGYENEDLTRILVIILP